MTDLAAQLLAALDRAEETARAATPGPWHATHDPLGTHVENGDGRGRIVMRSGKDRVDGSGVTNAAHIAANDPAHVLRLCAALREVVKLHYGVDFGTIEGIGHVDLCHDCRDERWPCPTLLALASVWDVPGVAE